MGKTFLLLLILSLLGYGLSLIGVPGSFVDSIWKLIALGLGVSLLAGWLYPMLRGVRKHDPLVAVVRRQAAQNNMLQTFFDSYTVTAQEPGRVGEKIKVVLWNGKRAEGIITSYAGALTPASIRLTESEV